MSKPDSKDDTFELYDLKVEVVCPPNERILCGAKNGDYFILEGEMLRLPPRQGFSIYSLCKCALLLSLAFSRGPTNIQVFMGVI
jgi:uncharacterized repeat protein (TIGR04076 family)